MSSLFDFFFFLLPLISSSALRLDQTKVVSLLASSAAVGIEAVGVQSTLLGAGTRGLAVLGITVGMDVHLLVQLSHIDLGHVELGQLAVLGTLDDDVGAVMVELLGGVSGPREGKETLVGICARGDVLGNLDRPLVVDIGASLGVLANDLPGLATVVRERELAGTTTVAGLGQAVGWGELLVVLDLKVPEADGNDLTSLVGGDGTLLVATAGELLAFVTNPGMDGSGGVLGPGTSLGRGVGDGHVGRSGGEEGEEGSRRQGDAAGNGEGLHCCEEMSLRLNEERGKEERRG